METATGQGKGGACRNKRKKTLRDLQDIVVEGAKCVCVEAERRGRAEMREVM